MALAAVPGSVATGTGGPVRARLQDQEGRRGFDRDGLEGDAGGKTSGTCLRPTIKAAIAHNNWATPGVLDNFLALW